MDSTTRALNPSQFLPHKSLSQAGQASQGIIVIQGDSHMLKDLIKLHARGRKISEATSFPFTLIILQL